jgi:hypothetical protein
MIGQEGRRNLSELLKADMKVVLRDRKQKRKPQNEMGRSQLEKESQASF